MLDQFLQFHEMFYVFLLAEMRSRSALLIVRSDCVTPSTAFLLHYIRWNSAIYQCDLSVQNYGREIATQRALIS